MSRLPQTDVFTVISQNPRDPFLLRDPYEVSLSDTVSRVFTSVGSLWSPEGYLGSGSLISANLMLVARHSIEGMDVRGIRAIFGYFRLLSGGVSQSYSYGVEGVVDDHPGLDYAVLKLKSHPGLTHGFMSLFPDHITADPALLHHPLGGGLKVSVHAVKQTGGYYAMRLETYHDSDYNSSGGAYIDAQGALVAMHLGSELNHTHFNLQRYALPITEIVSDRPSGLVASLASGRLDPKTPWAFQSMRVVLRGVNRSFVLDEEGYQSKKILSQLLAPHRHDRHIRRDRRGLVTLSATNLQYIQSHYPTQYRQAVRQCSNLGGIHGATKQYSIRGVIESDHLLPYDVWTRTQNTVLRGFVAGSGTRPGENGMPAITIPYQAHRHLLTTGSGRDNKHFRDQLVRLCDAGNISGALRSCLADYKAKGVLTHHRTGTRTAINRYAELDIITPAQATRLIREFRL